MSASVAEPAAPSAAPVARVRRSVQTITIPGEGRTTLRRSAKDDSAGLSAYLVSDDKGVSCRVAVSLKRGERLVGTTLRGHRADVVDMQFVECLPAGEYDDSAMDDKLEYPPGEAADIYTLGSCDKDGVVFLWFLEVVKNALNIETALRVRRKYSFYSLRKNREAFYSRIRLAGSYRRGHMVLVPNDGSNVRVIRFRCDAPASSGAVPVIEAPIPTPELPADESHQTDPTGQEY